MSHEFQKFSDAAQLYAKHSAVVEQIEELYKTDISKFFEALRNQVKSQVQKGEFAEEGNIFRQWWIEDEGSLEDDDVPYLHFRTEDPKIVVPGVLVLEIHAEGALKPYHKQLATMLTELRLPITCKKENTSGGWGLMFKVTITFGDKHDPVGMVAEPIVALLTALYQAEQKYRTALRTANEKSKKDK